MKNFNCHVFYKLYFLVNSNRQIPQFDVYDLLLYGHGIFFLYFIIFNILILCNLIC